MDVPHCRLSQKWNTLSVTPPCQRNGSLWRRTIGAVCKYSAKLVRGCEKLLDGCADTGEVARENYDVDIHAGGERLLHHCGLSGTRGRLQG